MTELLAVGVEVAVAPDGAPAAVRLPDGGGRRRVERVLAHWRIETDWWAIPLQRDCWRCLLAGGDCVELACEAGGWLLLRRYD